MMEEQHRIKGGKIPPDVPHTTFKMHLKQSPAGFLQNFQVKWHEGASV
jgi:hypothetical protein